MIYNPSNEMMAGTKPGTCYDQPSIGGVMKLTSLMDEVERSVIKLARDNPIKCSIQGSNKICWVWEKDVLLCSLIYHKTEDPRQIKRAYHPDDPKKYIDLTGRTLIYEERHQQVIHSKPTLNSDYNEEISTVRERVKKDTNRLHWTYKRIQNSHNVKVNLSQRVSEQRMKMIERKKLID